MVQRSTRCLTPYISSRKLTQQVAALVFSPQTKYLYVGRDRPDVLWSLYNHHANANASFYEILNNTPGRVGPPIEPPSDSIQPESPTQVTY